MKQTHNNFQAQRAMFFAQLETFKDMMNRNGVISNEVYDLFAEIDNTKYESGLLRTYADKVISQMKQGTPLLPASNKQV